jgi:DNA-binding response OmpR family regulator
MPEYRILGPLEVSDETGHLQLGGLKQRAVLALLLLEDGRVVSVDRLVDALWGERPPRTVRSAPTASWLQRRARTASDGPTSPAPDGGRFS